jgi:hypothetical protein
MPEPVPLHYVVLRHEGVAEPHYDLMLEVAPGSALATWRLNEWPPTQHATFTPLPDHRRAYLTYEGPISGDRGTVRRIAGGHHRLIAIEEALVTVQLETREMITLPRSA